MAEVKDVISELGKDIEDTKSLINTAHEAL